MVDHFHVNNENHGAEVVNHALANHNLDILL